ncbi:hypothetical protein X975_16403, partial [Stegodyphus mimosarum]
MLVATEIAVAIFWLCILLDANFLLSPQNKSIILGSFNTCYSLGHRRAGDVIFFILLIMPNIFTSVMSTLCIFFFQISLRILHSYN